MYYGEGSVRICFLPFTVHCSPFSSFAGATASSPPGLRGPGGDLAGFTPKGDSKWFSGEKGVEGEGISGRSAGGRPEPSSS